MTIPSTSSPISQFASTLVVTVRLEDPLEDAARLLLDRRLSSLLVVGADGLPAGVLSRRDLLLVGRLATRGHLGHEALELPPRAVAEIMTHPVVSLGIEATVADGAAAMLSRRIHRVFLVDRGRAVGVFSTRDAMAAVRAIGIATPIATLMSRQPVTIPCTAPLSQALAALQEQRISGVVVLDGEIPVGVFGEVEALASRSVDRDETVEGRFDTSILFLPGRVPAFRAAAFVTSTTTRRILVVAPGSLAPIGIVSGLDFCRALLPPPSEQAQSMVG